VGSPGEDEQPMSTKKAAQRHAEIIFFSINCGLKRQYSGTTDVSQQDKLVASCIWALVLLRVDLIFIICDKKLWLLISFL
jgi:hypothetical protein